MIATLRITIADLVLIARLEEEVAPRTCAAFAVGNGGVSMRSRILDAG